MITPSRLRQRRAGARLGRCSGDESGLTLVELVVSLMVVFICLTALAGIFVGALKTMTVAKERQSATALGTRAMEQLRALPFSEMTAGLHTADLTGDPNITGAPARLKPAIAPSIDEVLQTNTPSTPPPTSCGTSPLLPHVCPQTLDGVGYEVASYVSQVPGTTPVEYSLTTIVTWTSPASGAADKFVVNRSRAFSPNGTCAPANHPFNTPCQSQFHANAGLSESGVTLVGTVADQPFVSGLDVVSAELTLPRLTTSTAVEQTVSVSGRTAPHTARIVGAADEVTSGEQGLSSASSDPSNTAGSVTTATAAPAAPLTRTGAGWTVTAKPEVSGSWTTTSRTAAAASSGCEDSNGLAIDTTGQPCGSSRATQGAAATLTVKPGVLDGRHLPVFEVARVGAPSAPSRAFSARFTSPRATWCPTATGTGCASAGAKHVLGSTVVGALPAPTGSDVVPGSFVGAVLVDGYQSTASASTGTGTAVPTATRSGTLKTFDGSTYTTTDLSSVTTLLDLPVSATATYPGASGWPVTVRITGSVQVTPPTTSAATCVSTVCDASSGMVLANLSYEFLTGPALTPPAATFNLTADLGTLLAKTSYKGI